MSHIKLPAGLTPEEEAEYLALLEAEYAVPTLEDFIKGVGVKLPPPEHVAPLIKLIERTRREEVRALISMPPRFCKTYTLIGA